MTPNVPLIAWDPDGDPTRPGVMVEVSNLRPTRRGYGPEYGLGDAGAVYGATIASNPYSTALMRQPNGNELSFVTTIDSIGYISGGVVNDRTGTGWTDATPELPWRLAQFGTVTLACQRANLLQASTQITTTDFSDVAGTYHAGTIAVQRGFVLIANFNGGGSTDLDGWACSALEDHTDWTPDIATQAAEGRLTATPGMIRRLIAWRDYVIAFKSTSMYRGTYVGAADNTWAWPVVSSDVGLVGHDAVCEAEGVLYWIGMDGIYRWAGGVPQRIASAPWNWLMSYGVLPGLSTLQYAVAVWDAVHRLVRWSIVIPGSVSGYVLSYHPDTDRWGLSAPESVMPLYMWQQEAAAISDSTEAGLRYLQVGWIGSDLVVRAQNATPGASSFTTGDIGDDEEVLAMTRARARMLIAPTTSTVTHYHRMNLGDSLTEGATIARSDGKYDVTHSARWHRLKFSQTGRYEVTGFRVETPKAGKQ